ncbi:MAG: hypothetical protein ACRD22_10180 [Terriglobia bacterium]
MGVEIRVDLALVNARPPLQALADIVLRESGLEVTIRRCAVFEKPGEPPWANLPRLPVEKNGKRQFVSLIDLPHELKQRVLDALLAEYRTKSNARA